MKFPQLGLKPKVSAIALIPFLSFTIMAGLRIHSDVSRIRAADHDARLTVLASALSATIHETQKERGKTATFLSGAIAIDELNAKRVQTDDTLPRLRNQLEATRLDSGDVEEARQALEQLPELRKKVETKAISAQDAISGYTRLVGQLLLAERSLASRMLLDGLEAAMTSANVLEAAKENAGRLRANLSAVLSKDAPLTDEQFTLLVQLKSGVDGNIQSPALFIASPDFESKAGAFLSSSHWTEVNHTFQSVLKRAAEGKYGKDPKAFFNTITTSIDQIAELIREKLSGTEDDAARIRAEALRSAWIIGGVIAIMILVLGAGIPFTIRTVTLPAHRAIHDLREVATGLLGTSRSLLESSKSATETNDQANTSLSMTTAALDEMGNMIRRTSENSEQATVKADRSRQSAEHGTQVMNGMNRTIEEIGESNRNIIDHIERSNASFSDIVAMITEIGTKTQIINDIVFQTRLLSFNASVEAARAGEHGKGFAVVAEEVGKLAQVSGASAKEINDLLESSSQKVKSIVDETRSRLDGLVAEVRTKIDSGTQVARETGTVFEEIARDVNEISSMISEISTGCQEQRFAISEISNAMEQMNQVTRRNLEATDTTKTNAETLLARSERLEGVVSALTVIMNGD